LVKAAGIRTYLNEQELTEAVALVAGPNGQHKVDENLALFRRTLGSPLVTVTLGQRGSMVMNHAPFLTRAYAARVSVSSLVGAGDTLMTTATLSAATGAQDGCSCLRGNMDAARHVASKPPAGSLGELDHEIAQHPEMTEQQIPFPD
jgi:fructose-1-phosphate kinase PfkB-like protein